MAFSLFKGNGSDASQRQEDGRSASLPVDRRAACINDIQNRISNPKSRGTAIKIYLQNFKTLNDIFGYQFGEDFLRTIKEYLSDLSDEVVHRYTGVEFILLLESCPVNRALDLVDQILERFEHAWRINNTDCLCDVQIGIATWPGYAHKAEELLHMLDDAIEDASQMGPNTYTIYDDILHAKVCRAHTIANTLQNAIDGDQIEILFRPVWCTATNRFTRANCCMRLFIQNLGMVTDREFIEAAEDSGQAVNLEYYILNKVCEMIRKLIDANCEFENIAISLSPVMFFQSDFCTHLENLLNRHHIPASKLAIEINESQTATAYLSINMLLQELQDLGVELILNDFGTGFSSINSILDLPLNAVKLERMFLYQLETNPQSAIVMETLVHMVKSLGLRVIAEGVESERQLAKLDEWGCAYRQGLYYSATVEMEKLTEMFSGR